MKLSQKTIEILNNFKDITEGPMRFDSGNVLRAKCPSNKLWAQARISESFERGFVIQDMKTLLSLHSLFKEPELNILDDHMEVGIGNRTFKYVYGGEFLVPENKTLKEIESFSEFNVSYEEIKSLKEASRLLNIEHISIQCDGAGDNVKLTCENIKKPTDNMVVTTDVTSDKRFKCVTESKNLKIIDGNYKVSCTQRYIKFAHENGVLEYIIALNTLSEV